MIAPPSTLLQRLGQYAWLHKSARTLLVVAPSRSFFVSTAEQHGVMFAFAALCLSVPYGDRGSGAVHLAGCAVVSGFLMPAAVWRQYHPALYSPIFAMVGVAHVLVSRSAILPPRMPSWVLIYLLYESSELHGEGWSTVVTAVPLVAPTALWVDMGCFDLWPWRGEETSGRATVASEPEMSVPLNTACAALSIRAGSLVKLHVSCGKLLLP